jgi:integrase
VIPAEPETTAKDGLVFTLARLHAVGHKHHRSSPGQSSSPSSASSSAMFFANTDVKSARRGSELGCVHSLRTTAATNALLHAADIAKVQEWLGHENVSTTRIYDQRKTRPEGSPHVSCEVLVLWLVTQRE